MEDEKLAIGEAARYIGVSIDTLRRWVSKGKIVAYKSKGGHRYFDRRDLDKIKGSKFKKYKPPFLPKKVATLEISSTDNAYLPQPNDIVRADSNQRSIANEEKTNSLATIETNYKKNVSLGSLSLKEKLAIAVFLTFLFINIALFIIVVTTLK